MKLKAVEKFLIRSPLRAHMLQRLEAPRVLSNLDIGERSVCLDIFDAVFLFGVLHHIKGWEKAISEVYRTLKVGGVFSFVEETLLPGFFSSSGRLGFYVAKSYKLVGAVPISEGELKAVLEKSGFFIQRFEKLLSLCFVRATKRWRCKRDVYRPTKKRRAGARNPEQR